jgi:hypothetical protein
MASDCVSVEGGRCGNYLKSESCGLFTEPGLRRAWSILFAAVKDTLVVFFLRKDDDVLTTTE